MEGQDFVLERNVYIFSVLYYGVGAVMDSQSFALYSIPFSIMMALSNIKAVGTVLLT